MRAAAPAVSGGTGEGRLALPVVLFFVGMILPPEVSVSVGSFRMSGYRVVLIAMIVPLLFMLLAGRRGRINVFDILVIAHALWAVAALVVWGGLQGVESGGIYFIECVGAYLLGRVFIRDEADFRRFAGAFVALVVGMLVVTLPESLTGVHFVRDTAAAGLGGPGAPYIDPRMGIERAFGPFDHPILYGVFSASAFSLAYFVVTDRNPFTGKGAGVCGGVVLATFLSASGGPYTALAAQMAVCGWERVTKGLAGRWLLLIGLFVLLYVAIDLLSNRSPVHVFVSYLTFSTQSAYNRINIFHFGSAEVAQNPVFGIGLGDWERPPWMSDSVDNFWLLTAMRYGLPALALLAGMLLALVVTVAHRPLSPRQKKCAHGWAFTLFGLAVVACTVHLWNALFVLFLFLIGSGVWLTEARAGTSAAQPVPTARAPAAAPSRPGRDGPRPGRGLVRPDGTPERLF